MKYLYNSPLPESAATDERDRLGQQLAEAGLLDEDSAMVESIASQAADLTLEGQYRWGEDVSTMLATELDELSGASTGALPLYRRSGGYPNAGYYEIASADVAPLHANDRSVWRYTLSLTHAGARGRHFRAIEPTQRQLDHEFGTDTQALVAVPTTASKVRWFDPESKAIAQATTLETRAAEPLDVDVYDLADGEAAVGVSDPWLIYDVSYADDVRTGVRAYDTRGNAEKFMTTGDGSQGPRQWQTIHSTGHDITNEIVLDNGLLRLRPDETAGTMSAEMWDDTNGVWSDTGLAGTQPATVTLLDVDLTAVSMVRDVVQLLFDVDGSLFALNAIVAKGYDEVLFSIPENETGPIPTDLETWLSSIASSSITDPNAAKTLVPRSEVRR
ncbi:hypothetical protein [Salinilacihabitans rarus]|uniref:hypothetical protein n=1 Tax=Salinilacihabitans rarus TaxID=2961596 RepID=UPI0020C89DF7|nr:hypothetical protein [Salinilacihabitans rarus]